MSLLHLVYELHTYIHIYLRKRHLKPDFISLDYEHFIGSGSPDFSGVPEKQEKTTEFEIESDAGEQQSILDSVVDWIAKRTGFPTTSILPDMKLRDDLNLDSIKVGELVYTICKKLGKKTPADPSAFANIRLDKLISLVQNDFHEQSGGGRDVGGGR